MGDPTTIRLAPEAERRVELLRAELGLSRTAAVNVLIASASVAQLVGELTANALRETLRKAD